MNYLKYFLLIFVAVSIPQSQSYAFSLSDEIHNAGDIVFGPSHRQQEAARKGAEAADKALQAQKDKAAQELAAQQAEDAKKLAAQQAKAAEALKKQEAATSLVLAEQKAKFQMEIEADKAKYELIKKQQELEFEKKQSEINLAAQREYIVNLQNMSDKEQAANTKLQSEIAELNRKHNLITALIGAIAVIVGALIPIIFNKIQKKSERDKQNIKELHKNTSDTDKVTDALKS